MADENDLTRLTQSRYDRIAPIYDLMESPMEIFLARDWRELIWSKVEGDNVLEVGVGTGKNIPYYPEESKVTAIDISEKMLGRARKKTESADGKVELLRMDAQKMDFEDDLFETTVATFVFCSVPDPVQGLREINRVTKPGGQVLLLEHMRPETELPGRLFDVLNPIVVRLLGFNINRRTIENIEKSGLEIEGIKKLAGRGIVKLIEATPNSKGSRTPPKN